MSGRIKKVDRLFYVTMVNRGMLRWSKLLLSILFTFSFVSSYHHRTIHNTMENHDKEAFSMRQRP